MILRLPSGALVAAAGASGKGRASEHRARVAAGPRRRSAHRPRLRPQRGQSNRR